MHSTSATTPSPPLPPLMPIPAHVATRMIIDLSEEDDSVAAASSYVQPTTSHPQLLQPLAHNPSSPQLTSAQPSSPIAAATASMMSIDEVHRVTTSALLFSPTPPPLPLSIPIFAPTSAASSLPPDTNVDTNIPDSAVAVASSPIAATAAASSYQHRPRLVRKPSPIVQQQTTRKSPTSIAASSSTVDGINDWLRCIRERGITERGDAKDIEMKQQQFSNEEEDKENRPPNAVTTSPNSTSRPSVSRRPSLFDCASMEVDFDAIDVDAIVAQATMKPKSQAIIIEAKIPSLPHHNHTTSEETKNQDIIDLTDDHCSSLHHPTSTSLPLPSTTSTHMVDIEELNAPPPSIPLALRRKPAIFFVTDFSAMNWCEKQVDIVLRHGKRKPQPKAQAVMDAGVAIHLAYELETVEKVEITPESSEDIWALRLLNMMLGIQELRETGRTRELPVFGCVSILLNDGVSYETMWIMGIIDEIVRIDLFHSEMKRKAEVRDAMTPTETPRTSSLPPSPVIKAAVISSPRPAIPVKSSSSSSISPPTRLTASSSSPPPTSHRSASVSYIDSNSPRIKLSAEKRKREDQLEFESLFDTSTLKPTSIMLAPSSVCDEQLVILQCHVDGDGLVGAEIQVAPATSTPSNSATSSTFSQHQRSQSLIDMEISDDDVWQILTDPTESQTGTSTAKSVSACHRSASLPPLPPRPTPPLASINGQSHDFVVLDHKTRASNSMPSLSQKIGTYLQISIYKLLLDRWLGTKTVPTKDIKQTATHLSYTTSAPPDAFDAAIAAPFPLEDFFAHFELNSSRPLGQPLQTHLIACGLSPTLTLGDLLVAALRISKSTNSTYQDMKVEYEYQKDGRHIGHDTYTYDQRWLEDELQHHMAYWLGFRVPSAVQLHDGFKCSRCDYQDLCDERVEKYKRVGRLALPPPTAAIESTISEPMNQEDQKQSNNIESKHKPKRQRTEIQIQHNSTK